MSMLTDRVVPRQRARGSGAGQMNRQALAAPPVPPQAHLTTGAHRSAGVLERPHPVHDDEGPSAAAAVPEGPRLRRTHLTRHAARVRRIDAAMAVVAGAVGYLTHVGVEGRVHTGYLAVTFAIPAAWLVLVGASRGYEHRFLRAGAEESRRIVQAGLTLCLVGFMASYGLALEGARSYVVVVAVTVTILTAVGRLVLRGLLRRQRTTGRGWQCRVVVAGHDQDVARVVTELQRARGHGFEVVGVCLADSAGAGHHGVPSVSGLDRVAEVTSLWEADAVLVLPCRHYGPAALRRLGWELEASRTELLIGTGLMDVSRHRTTVSPVGGLQLLHVHHAELTGGRRLAKDVFDRTVASMGLVLMAPLMLVLMAAVRLDSRGPATFRQQRVGLDGSRFTLLKLRTMAVDAEDRKMQLGALNESDGVLFKMRDDPRITRVGRFLRRYSLDELPQLVNVMLGDMSLVGPRPPLPSEVERYEDDVRRRLVVKPGLTGLWQISGRSDLPWEEAVRLDLRYVDNWSLLLDLSILWRTGRAVLSRSGAY